MIKTIGDQLASKDRVWSNKSDSTGLDGANEIISSFHRKPRSKLNREVKSKFARAPHFKAQPKKKVQGSSNIVSTQCGNG